MKDLSDTQLVTLLQQGSEHAFREIYVRHWKFLYETAYRKTNPEDACDIVQEIFLSLWKNRDGLRMEVQLNTYLGAALRHKIIDHYRLKMARGTFYEEAFPPGTLPPADYETKELNNIIRSTVSRMPERMREIFVLNRDSGLPSAEITKKSQK